MQLDENLLKDFAAILNSSSDVRDNYQLGTVLAVNGGELQVLLDRAIGDVRFAGYAFNRTSLLNRYFVTPHDGMHFIYTNDIGNVTIPVDAAILRVYNAEDGEWQATDDPYTPNVGDLITFISPADITGTQTVYQCVQNGSMNASGKYVMTRSFEVYNGLTPCSTYVKCLPGDKVAVRLINNTAVVIGNLTSPAITQRDMDYLEEEI